MGMESRFVGAFVGMLVGDSLGSGIQWINSIDDIHRQYGWVKDYCKAQKNHCHSRLEEGQNTAAGEIAYLLASTIQEKKEFRPEEFATKIKEFFTSDTLSLYCLSTIIKDTLARASLQDEKLAGLKDPKRNDTIAWVTPIALRYWKSEKELSAHTESLARLSTDKDEIIEASNLISFLLARLLSGRKPEDAFENAMKSASFSKLLKGKLSTVKPKLKNNTIQTIREYGIGGDLDMIIPASLYAFIKYKDDFENGLEYTINAGGESSGRGAIVGSLVGAYLGFEAIPQRWRYGLKKYQGAVDIALAIYEASGPPPPKEMPKYYKKEVREEPPADQKVPPDAPPAEVPTGPKNGQAEPGTPPRQEEG